MNETMINNMTRHELEVSWQGFDSEKKDFVINRLFSIIGKMEGDGIFDLKSSLRAAEETIDELESDIDSLNDEIDDLKEKIKELQEAE